MTTTTKAICVILGILCALNALIPSQTSSAAEGEQLKGVWAATVFSLDYPTSATTDPQALKKDADRLIEKAKALGYNALFFQVRPAGDAFYKSENFPWSKHLTGAEGIAPLDGFDPLTYITEAAHQSGLKLHAWINPYRLTASANDSDTQPECSIAKKFPHLVVKHTDGKLYLNPGEPEAIQLVVDGALEILQNYNIDGIHIDDYFYPSSAFPDGETFTKYGGSFSNIGDWRRSNTTELVRKLNTAIKKAKPDCIFSVSPCGIWANKDSHPDGSDTSGVQSYFDYYADTRLWVREELMDMIIPQIYWNTGNAAADFALLSKWWNDAVSGTNVSLCIGQAVYKAAEETDPHSPWFGDNGFSELKSQLKQINALENSSGYIHYRLGSIGEGGSLQKLIADLNTKGLPIFTDTDNYPWARDAIEALHKKGIVNGMGDGSFGPSRTVSRADFTLMLVRLTQQNVPFTENFADVTEDKYYYKEIGIAKALGYITGRDDNTFDPTGNITREDMAVLVHRVLTRQGKTLKGDPKDLIKRFPDASEISEYAKEAVAAMTEKGYLSGYETGEFKPKGFATRAETAVLLHRISE